MSTIVVVRKNGIASIGADTLTTLGSTLESAKYIVNSSKIEHIGESYFASVGHASFGLILSSYFSKSDVEPDLDSPRAIFEMARSLHISLKEDYFLNPTEDAEDPFESLQHQIFIANSHGIFGLYALRSVQEYSRFYAFGSGYKFALGAMHAVYNSTMNSEEIAYAGLMASAEFDDATSEPLEIRTVALKPS
jgi:ATP-dependent protease HslVU (ClpYQ) peptidase subunit